MQKQFCFYQLSLGELHSKKKKKKVPAFTVFLIIFSKTVAEVTDDSMLATEVTPGLKVFKCNKMGKTRKPRFFQCWGSGAITSLVSSYWILFRT